MLWVHFRGCTFLLLPYLCFYLSKECVYSCHLRLLLSVGLFTEHRSALWLGSVKSGHKCKMTFNTMIARLASEVDFGHLQYQSWSKPTNTDEPFLKPFCKLMKEWRGKTCKTQDAQLLFNLFLKPTQVTSATSSLTDHTGRLALDFKQHLGRKHYNINGGCVWCESTPRLTVPPPVVMVVCSPNVLPSRRCFHPGRRGNSSWLFASFPSSYEGRRDGSVEAFSSSI